MRLSERFEQARQSQRCGCGQQIGATGDHTVELHERHDAREQQRPRWQQRSLVKDTTPLVLS